MVKEFSIRAPISVFFQKTDQRDRRWAQWRGPKGGAESAETFGT